MELNKVKELKTKVNNAINNNMPEPIIRNLYKEFFKEMVRSSLIRKYTKEYEITYPVVDNKGKEIRYIVYTDVKPIEPDPDSNEEISYEPIIPKEYCEYNIPPEELIGSGVEEDECTLKEEYKDYILKPSYELYLRLNMEKENIPELDINMYLNFIKPYYKNRTQKLADDKTQLVKNYMADKIITPEQVERYKDKYDIAVEAKESGDYSLLQTEAALKNMAVEDLADLIINLGDLWKNGTKRFNMLIESIRIKVNEIIDNINTLEELDSLNKLLNEAAILDINTTEEDVINLVLKYFPEESETEESEE